MSPGEDGGDCPRCGATTTQIGYDNAVLGVVCEDCSLMLAISGEAMTLREAMETDWSDWQPIRGSSYGPDPWG